MDGEGRVIGTQDVDTQMGKGERHGSKMQELQMVGADQRTAGGVLWGMPETANHGG